MGLLAEQFLNWLDAEGNDAGSILDLIPAYFEYRIDTTFDYNGASFKSQLRKLCLNSDCVEFIDEQVTKFDNVGRQDALYYALQYCLHRFHIIFELSLDPPITSTRRNEIVILNIQITEDLFGRHFRQIRIKNYLTTNINIGLEETSFIESNDNYLFFHATSVTKAVSIIRNGIDASCTRLNLDFGPAFYLNRHFEDTKDWCSRRIAPFNDGQAAILIFQVPQDIYELWKIYGLNHENQQPNLENLTQWQHFVRCCRFNNRNNRAISNHGGFEGPQCANPRNCDREPPEKRYTNEAIRRMAWQISINSSELQAQLINYLAGIITFIDLECTRGWINSRGWMNNYNCVCS